jgi:hypothetical protein
MVRGLGLRLSLLCRSIAPPSPCPVAPQFIHPLIAVCHRAPPARLRAPALVWRRDASDGLVLRDEFRCDDGYLAKR